MTDCLDASGDTANRQVPDDTLQELDLSVDLAIRSDGRRLVLDPTSGHCTLRSKRSFNGCRSPFAPTQQAQQTPHSGNRGPATRRCGQFVRL